MYGKSGAPCEMFRRGAFERGLDYESTSLVIGLIYLQILSITKCEERSFVHDPALFVLFPDYLEGCSSGVYCSWPWCSASPPAQSHEVSWTETSAGTAPTDFCSFKLIFSGVVSQWRTAKMSGISTNVKWEPKIHAREERLHAYRVKLIKNLH